MICFSVWQELLNVGSHMGQREHRVRNVSSGSPLYFFLHEYCTQCCNVDRTIV